MSRTGWRLLAILLLAGAAISQESSGFQVARAQPAGSVTVRPPGPQYNMLRSYKDGPAGRTVERIRLPVGPVESPDGLRTPPIGQALPPGRMALTFGHMPPYSPFRAQRKSAVTFSKGEPVFLLEDAEGAPWVMLAFSRTIDSTLTHDTLKELASKLKPPAGWKFRVMTFDRNLTISALQDYNWMVQDELRNTYGACKDGACSFQP
jgi:hypothetical protein